MDPPAREAGLEDRRQDRNAECAAAPYSECVDVIVDGQLQ
jgi:hypothetical protein